MDAAAVAELRWQSVRQLGPRAYSAAQVRAWLPRKDSLAKTRSRCEDGRTVGLAWVGENLAGVVDLEADGHVDTLYVSPDHSGQGIGTALVRHVERLGRRAGLGALYTEASELARPVFASCGFEDVARNDFTLRGVPIHNYRMRKSLPRG